MLEVLVFDIVQVPAPFLMSAVVPVPLLAISGANEPLPVPLNVIVGEVLVPKKPRPLVLENVKVVLPAAVSVAPLEPMRNVRSVVLLPLPENCNVPPLMAKQVTPMHMPRLLLVAIGVKYLTSNTPPLIVVIPV